MGDPFGGKVVCGEEPQNVCIVLDAADAVRRRRMNLVFRNVAVDPSAPVRSWPTEAVQAALECGDLDDWRRLAEDVSREPWGRTARKLEEVLSHSRPYGVAEAMEGVIARARSLAERSERADVADEIRRSIDRSGLTRAEFAERTGTSASRLSTYVTGKVTPSAGYLVRVRRLLANSSVRPSHTDWEA